VLTGAPGNGKTALLRALGERGHAMVEEAATDVIAEQQANGLDAPWLREEFIDLIVARQRQRQTAPVPGAAEVQFYDRSPLCTLALARYLGHPVSRPLADEVERVLREQTYQPAVFVLAPLGFIQPTAARRISYADALAFHAVHENVYREHGFDLIDVPAGNLAERVRIVESHVAP
jgi:predicted ATPase